MNHTPAPWVLEFGVEPGSWEIYAANAIVVAARSRWSHRADESNANARLIAAAPELLEALKMVRDADEDCKRDGLPTIPAAARAVIDAAIAKAEGNG